MFATTPATKPWPILARASSMERPGLRQCHRAASTAAATGPPNSRIHASTTSGSACDPLSHGLLAYEPSPSGATENMTRPNSRPTPVPAASVAGVTDDRREVTQRRVTT